MRPGILRACSVLVAMNAACGPPKPIGTPKRCAEPTAMSAPNSPGGLISVSASRSAAKTTSAPLAWALFDDVACNRRSGRRWSGYCTQDAEEFSATAKSADLDVADDDFDPQRFRPRLHDGDRLRMAIIGDEERDLAHRRTFGAGDVRAHRHRLGGGGAFVQQRCVGQRQAGQVAHHRLEIQQRFEPALGDLRLVGRVLRVPAGIFQDVPLNHRRRDRVVIAHADERAEDLVLRRDLLQFVEQFEFAARLADASAASSAGWRRARSARPVRPANRRPAASSISRTSSALGPDVPADEGVGRRRGSAGGRCCSALRLARSASMSVDHV